MKKIFLVLFFIPVIVQAQEYSEVIYSEGKTADQLYYAAYEWMALVFNSANDVIQLSDPNNHKLIAKGVRSIQHNVNGVPMPTHLYFTLLTEFKDGRYRYKISATSIENRMEKYSYDMLQSVSTKEGLLEYYKAKGIKPGILGKKQLNRNIEFNKKLLTKIDQSLLDITNNFKKSLIKTDNSNW